MTLSSVAGVLTEVGLAVGTVVVRVHAVIHAEGDEAAPEVALDVVLRESAVEASCCSVGWKLRHLISLKFSPAAETLEMHD